MTSPPGTYSSATGKVLRHVAAERERQDRTWGPSSHPDGTGPAYAPDAARLRERCQQRFAAGEGTWADILQEEVAEALSETDRDALRDELLQVAAVAVAWVEDIDRRP